MDITKFQLKRINAFQGLVIDADTWQDAHNYHRDQQRLHLLAFHNVGIVSGLEVTAMNPADSSVNISPGIAVDPDGNVIVVQQKQRYRLQTHDKGTIYLVLQFRDIPSEPFQPPEGGQPTRILEAYRIQEREKLANEPYVELARIEYDPEGAAIHDAKNTAKPGINEINLNFRIQALTITDHPKHKAEIQAPVTPQPAQPATPPPPPPQPVQSAPPAPAVSVEPPKKKTFSIGHAVLGNADKNLHTNGLRYLSRELRRVLDLDAAFDKNIDLSSKELDKYNVIYLTGTGNFELPQNQVESLNNYVKNGGAIFGQVCSQGTEQKDVREFGLAFNRLASQLNAKLGMVQRGHEILSSVYIFSAVPEGCEPAMLMENNRVVYSGSDYGCAWEGGQTDKPLSREAIRTSFEIGLNIMAFTGRIKI